MGYTFEYEFDLLENAKHSLRSCVQNFPPRDAAEYKVAIIGATHALELVLKEKLHRIDPKWVWRDPDRYPATPAITVDTREALRRLANHGVRLHAWERDLLWDARGLRNAATHSWFSVPEDTARETVGELLSLAIRFIAAHLDEDLEAELKESGDWEWMVTTFEFWVPHARETEARLRRDGARPLVCGHCAGQTYVTAAGECALCGSTEPPIQCSRCEELVGESQIETLHSIERGGRICAVHLCPGCLKMSS